MVNEPIENQIHQTDESVNIDRYLSQNQQDNIKPKTLEQLESERAQQDTTVNNNFKNQNNSENNPNITMPTVDIRDMTTSNTKKDFKEFNNVQNIEQVQQIQQNENKNKENSILSSEGGIFGDSSGLNFSFL